MNLISYSKLIYLKEGPVPSSSSESAEQKELIKYFPFVDKYLKYTKSIISKSKSHPNYERSKEKKYIPIWVNQLNEKFLKEMSVHSEKIYKLSKMPSDKEVIKHIGINGFTEMDLKSMIKETPKLQDYIETSKSFNTNISHACLKAILDNSKLISGRLVHHEVMLSSLIKGADMISLKLELADLMSALMDIINATYKTLVSHRQSHFVVMKIFAQKKEKKDTGGEKGREFQMRLNSYKSKYQNFEKHKPHYLSLKYKQGGFPKLKNLFANYYYGISDPWIYLANKPSVYSMPLLSEALKIITKEQLIFEF
ncbi:hypothetical protein JW911_00515 [Candidatus Peregrinibacteria bacterium]|nr:hypothetical protein [Candidatus Peregrinibacteria bacterium]